MAVHKYLGLETEFGIVHRGVSESNPVAASSLLINAYVSQLSSGEGRPATHRAEWDFIDETPGRDARDDATGPSRPPEVETHLVNTVLSNGARFYVDHAHPEISTPECADPRSIVVWDTAAVQIVQQAMVGANAVLPPGEELVIYKNNSDGKGNSYGCHENYLMDRLVAFHKIVQYATVHFVTRQIFTGSGKIGSEIPGVQVDFQLTQRADFFEAEVGLETTLKRPIINTRDEPHADPIKYRRLHVICGDANLSEVATLLKVGTTAIVLAMIEDNISLPDIRFQAPVAAMRAVSRDISLNKPLTCVDGKSVTALEVQTELYQCARCYVDERGADAVGGEDVAELVLGHWKLALEGLATNPMDLADRVDWIAKYRLLCAFGERHGAKWSDPKMQAIALQYHDLRPDRSLAKRANLLRITRDEEVNAAVTLPPVDTRAYFRGTTLAKFPDSVVAANWDSMVFDVGKEPLRRVPMMEPGKGTQDLVGDVLASSSSAAELLNQLGM